MFIYVALCEVEVSLQLLRIKLRYAYLVHIAKAKLGHASTGDDGVNVMMKHTPEWVRTLNELEECSIRLHWLS